MSKQPRDERSPDAAPEEPAPAGPELRLIDRKAFVGLGAFELAPGMRIADLALQIPNVTFPFNVSGGASRYQKQRCLFGQLDLELAPSLFKDAETKLLQSAPELASLRLHLRSGFLEGEGALKAGGQAPWPFTCRIAFDGEGDGVAALVFDVRLYAPTALPAPLIAGVLARAAVNAKVTPGVQPRGFGAVSTSPLGELLRRTVPQRGFRLPEASAARLGSALVSPQGVTLRFSSGGPPPGGLADEELLLAVEGAHAFAEGEQLLEAGALGKAREFYLRAGELAQAHPFATERLIALLLGDVDVTDYALDLVRALAQRRPLSPAPLWMEAQLRLQRGERTLAAQRYLELAALSRGRGEEAAAFWAAQAAAQAATDPREQPEPRLAPLAVRALHESLGLRPDHLPSLIALAEAAERAGDDAAALRAYRRLTAVARDAVQAARAHVRLGELCARVEHDVAGARLHYDAALRLAPDEPDALLGLADLCARSGEPLRALRALDRVRALHPTDARLVGRAELEAGAVYEHGLSQLENAHLRYAEAARALPGDPEPLVCLGRVDERLGRISEAVGALEEAVELLGPEPGARAHLAHDAHRALGRIARDRLHDGARQRAHLEAAAALQPGDSEAWEELIPLYRADEAFAPLAQALALAAPRASEPRRKVAMWIESAELLRLRLGEPALARTRYQEALALEPRSREALEGSLALDELFGEPGAACEHLRGLLELMPPGPLRLPLLRRLAAAARDGKKDLDLAARATREILALAPDDLASLSELVLLQRRRGDLPALAEALEGWARGCERAGDPASTAAALRELAQLYDARLGRRDDALSALEKAHALAPADVGVLAELAELALATGRHRLARLGYRTLLTLLPPEKDVPARRAELHERLARAAEALGEIDEAAGALEEAYRLGDDDALAARLDALLAQVRRDDARIALARRRGAALSRAGRGSAASQVLSQGAALARALGDLPAATRDFTAALAADPSGPGAPATLDALAELAIAAGSLGEAAGHLARRAAMAPEPREAARLLFRAAGLCAVHDEPRALQLLGASTQRDATFAPAHAALAERRARAGDPAAAWREAEAALQVDPRDPDALDAPALAALERSAAHQAEQAGDLAAAERLLSRYLSRHPDDVPALEAQVALLRRLGEAQALAGALEKLEPRVEGAARVAIERELAGLFELRLERVDAALGAHRRVLRILPDDREALSALARLLVGPSEVDERVEIFDHLARLAASPDASAELHLRRGEVLRAALRHADAAGAFAAAARLATDPAPALESLIAAAEEAGQAPVALTARRQRAELAAERGERDAGVRLLEVAERLAEAGDAAGARACLDRLLAGVPSAELARAAHHAHVALAEAQGEPRLALTHLLALAPLTEPSARAPLLRRAAELALGQGDLEQAREALLEALRFAPRDLQGVRALVEVQARLGDEEGEVESLLQLAELEDEPAARVALWMRASALLRSIGAPARAEAALRKALALQPSQVPARRELCALLLERGAHAEGLLLLEQNALQEADPRRAAAELLEGASIALHAQGSRPWALRLARLAHGRAPGLPEAALRVAELSYLAGSTEEAAPLLSRALELAPGAQQPERFVRLALMLAELRASQGQPELATAPLQRAAELAPWRSDVALALHQATSAGDPRAALERLRQHLRGLHPGSGAHALLRYTAGEAEREGDLELAASLLEEALPTAHHDAEALERRLIALHLSLGHLLAAVALLRGQAVRARDAGEGEAALGALRRAAELLERAHELEGARSLWGEIAEGEIAAGASARAAEALVHRGLLSREAGALELAESDLRRAIDLDPTELQAVRLAAGVCRERGDAAGESELLGVEFERLEDGAERARVLLRRAELQRGALRDPAAAEATLRQALSLDPRLAAARDLYEALLRAADRPAELARSLLARAESTAEAAGQVALLREAAVLLERSGDLLGAAEALERARALAPGDEALALACAEAESRAGDDDACALIDTALLIRSPALEPCFGRELARRVAAADLRGQAALQQARAGAEPAALAAHRFLQAASLYERLPDLAAARRCELWAFERAPADDEAFARVDARHQGPEHLRDLDGILQRRAASVEPEAAALHLRRARLLQAHDALDEARAALDDALALGAEGRDPSVQREALVLRAELEAQAQGPAGAARFDERLVARDDLPAEVRHRVYARLGDARAAAGRDEEAARLWEAVAAEAPEAEALALYEKLAATYARQGQSEKQAEVMLARAERVPAERTGLLRAAAGLAGEGPLALRALRRLAEVSPQPAELLRLARLELALGEVAAGRESLVRAARAALVPSVQAQLLLEAAEKLALAGEPEAARALRAEARQADPHNLEALRLGAVDLRLHGTAEERRAVLERIVELEPELPNRVALRRELAELLAPIDPPRALEQLLAWAQLAEGPAALEPLRTGEALARAQGWTEPLAGILERLVAVEPQGRYALWLEAAQLWLGAENLARARNAWLRASELDASATAPWEGLAEVAARLGEGPEEARAREALALRLPEPQRAEVLVRAAEVWSASGLREPALDAYRRALALEPGRITWHRRLAELALALGQGRVALPALIAAAHLEASPSERAGALREAALLADALGDDAQAERLWTERLDADPLDAQAFERVTTLLRARSAGAELAEKLELRAAALSGADAAALWTEAAQLHDDASAHGLALRARLAAAEAQPDALGAWRAVRASAERAGDDSARVRALESLGALEERPGPRAEAWTALAAHHEAQGDAEGSLRALRQATLAAPSSLPLLEKLADLLEASGGWDELAERLATAPALPRELVLRRARALERSGKPGAAAEVLLAALPRQGEDPLVSSSLRALADAMAPADRAALLADWAPRVPLERRSSLLVELAGLSEGSARRTALEAAFEAAPEQDAAFELLRALLVEADDDRALAALLSRRAEALPDPRARGHLLMELGELYEGALDDLPAAEAAYEASLLADPQSVSVKRDLAELAFELGHDARSRALFEELVEGARAPVLPLLQERLALLAERGGSPAEAVDWLQRRLASPPTPALLLALRRNAQAAALPLAEEEALTSLLALGSAEPEVEAAWLGELSALEAARGDHPQALAHLVRRLELRPEDLDGWRTLRALARDADDGARVLDAASRLALLEPEPALKAAALLERAQLLDERGELAEACAAALSAHAQVPDDPQPLSLACALARRGALPAELGRAGLALAELEGEGSVQPFARELGEALLQGGDAAGAHRFLGLALADSPREPALLERLAALAGGLGRGREQVELERRLARARGGAEVATTLRALAERSERELGDPALAAELFDEAFALVPASDAELTAHAERLTALGHAAHAARILAERVRLAPGERARWTALAEAAEGAGLESLVEICRAVEAFREGALPELPSQNQLEAPLREALLAPLSSAWRQALASRAKQSWSALPTPATGLRQAGPVLVGRIHALADALGTVRPVVLMDPRSNVAALAGPDALVVGIGLFGLPARAQDFLLALALARAALALPFLGEDPATTLSAFGLDAPPTVTGLEALAEVLAAALVDDALASLVGRTAADPSLAQADPRAWDRAAAFDGPAQRGAAAALGAALARLALADA